MPTQGVAATAQRIRRHESTAIADAGNAEVVRSKRKVADGRNFNDTAEDVLIGLARQDPIIRPPESHRKRFLYVVPDRSKSNLATARHELRTFEKGIDVS